MAKKIPKSEKFLHESGKEVKMEKINGRRYFSSAVSIDTKALSYVCPNNKDKMSEEGHYYASHCSEKVKPAPKCPYCKSLTKLIDYDVKEKQENETAESA